MSTSCQILALALFIATTGAAQAQVSPADLNCDGTVNGLDIAPYVDCVLTANCPACIPQAVDLPALLDCLLTGNCPTTTPDNMVLIPGGEFQMGDHFNEGFLSERPVHTVNISAFRIGRYEVTNREYVEALNWAWDRGDLISVTGGRVYKAGSGTSLAYCDTMSSVEASPITWNGSTFGVTAGKEDHPMVLVTWHGAAAYCNWRSVTEGRDPCYDTETWVCDFARDGYRLPTEAEWEKAARGGQSNPYWRYPWGDAIDPSMANYTLSGSPAGRGTTPVGYFDGYQSPAGVDMANDYGLYDVAGNAAEWCYDWYSGSYYGSSPSDDPRGPATGTMRVLRGGAWTHLSDVLRCSYRLSYGPAARLNSNGFRLASGT